mmetsp:Transcript_15753/g.21954  ORF Transcript_15753/g.21954 Transcript_15753/m.21954 type:complete len:226 (+) Transcript_15753:365-1042(+)
MDQVDTILSLLKYRPLQRTLMPYEEQLLTELMKQLEFLYSNITAQQGTEDDRMLRSIAYLKSLVHQSRNTKSNTPANNNNTQTNNNTTSTRDVERFGIVTTDIKQGKIIYLLDGKPIKFKLLKTTTIYHKRWEDMYKELLDFYNTHGHIRITRGTKGFEELGHWTTEQRRKLKKGKMSQRQFEMLNELGFEWSRSHYFFRTHHKKPSETTNNSSEEGESLESDEQ